MTTGLGKKGDKRDWWGRMVEKREKTRGDPGLGPPSGFSSEMWRVCLPSLVVAFDFGESVDLVTVEPPGTGVGGRWPVI